ncbi:uncharacterized protein EV422DRAFT_381488 [Fimicolochytrium jonesii]|uniref:uncharacterized protein n=1 Tax=Fimicolochytrium jonesii TaxID=1396493 RepID=UPI0022FE3823|nr:uncharacterized protein EV422DRAFT_381488 [Fimicolochytrium jonesii]KAI8822860.1 hypothetical protein EV422DRAFT_381488 [Fimicolochytrium jonesii]
MVTITQRAIGGLRARNVEFALKRLPNGSPYVGGCIVIEFIKGHTIRDANVQLKFSIDFDQEHWTSLGTLLTISFILRGMFLRPWRDVLNSGDFTLRPECEEWQVVVDVSPWVRAGAANSPLSTYVASRLLKELATSACLQPCYVSMKSNRRGWIEAAKKSGMKADDLQAYVAHVIGSTVTRDYLPDHSRMNSTAIWSATATCTRKAPRLCGTHVAARRARPYPPKSWRRSTPPTRNGWTLITCWPTVKSSVTTGSSLWLIVNVGACFSNVRPKNVMRIFTGQAKGSFLRPSASLCLRSTRPRCSTSYLRCSQRSTSPKMAFGGTYRLGRQLVLLHSRSPHGQSGATLLPIVSSAYCSLSPPMSNPGSNWGSTAKT